MHSQSIDSDEASLSLKELAVGEEYVTVITFDMALYEKAVQLVDGRADLKGKVLPSLGELHVVMAALRALGSSIEKSGIDDAWIEAESVKQAKPVCCKRSPRKM